MAHLATPRTVMATAMAPMAHLAMAPWPRPSLRGVPGYAAPARQSNWRVDVPLAAIAGESAKDREIEALKRRIEQLESRNARPPSRPQPPQARGLGRLAIGADLPPHGPILVTSADTPPAAAHRRGPIEEQPDEKIPGFDVEPATAVRSRANRWPTTMWSTKATAVFPTLWMASSLPSKQRGMFINNLMHMNEMLERTGTDLGLGGSLFRSRVGRVLQRRPIAQDDQRRPAPHRQLPFYHRGLHPAREPEHDLCRAPQDPNLRDRARARPCKRLPPCSRGSQKTR